MRTRRSLGLTPTLARVPLLVAIAMIGALDAYSDEATAAESFACGPGGKANAKTGKCDCTAPKLEKTIGSTSKCVDPPAPKSTATATGTAKQVVKAPGKCPAGMALIPAGSYVQGTEKRVIAAFCLDLTEVTVAAYTTCAATGACTKAWSSCVYPLWTPKQLEGCADTCNTGKLDKVNHPINCIDWQQASAYCEAAGKRLPEHEEWEWAARGETKASTYPWGEDPPDAQVCWSGLSSRPTTCAVGSFPAGANPQGVNDLAGNLQEWTATKWPGADPLQITKGGTWSATTGAPLSAKNVNADPPTNRHNALGFRCARSI